MKRTRRKKSLFDSVSARLKNAHRRELKEHKKRKESRKKKRIPFVREKEPLYALTTLGQQKVENCGSDSVRNITLLSLADHGPQTPSSIAKKEGLSRGLTSRILWNESRPDRKLVRILKNREEDYDD